METRRLVVEQITQGAAVLAGLTFLAFALAEAL